MEQRRESILSYASRLGYEDAIERGEWNGATVYELILKKGGGDLHIGIPQFLLDTGEGAEGGFEIASEEEAFAILDSFDDGGEGGGYPKVTQKLPGKQQ